MKSKRGRYLRYIKSFVNTKIAFKLQSHYLAFFPRFFLNNGSVQNIVKSDICEKEYVIFPGHTENQKSISPFSIFIEQRCVHFHSQALGYTL
jgi:hypothetical protein